jgi:regulatory protein
VADTERPDGSLAPVTYLFGARPEPEPEGRSVEPTPARGDASTEPGWAVPGVDPGAPAAELLSPAEKAAAVKKARAALNAAASEKARAVDKAAVVDTAAADEPDTTRAHNVGLHALTKRGQSVAEMTKLLENRELEPDVVAAEIKRLKSVGLLDDFALAATLVRTLSERKKLGKSSIASELRQRKISPIAIDVALELLDGDDELSRATEVAIKRAGQLRSYDETTAKRRLSAYLQRRGYSGSVLSGAMSAAFHPSGGSRSGGPRFE